MPGSADIDSLTPANRVQLRGELRPVGFLETPESVQLPGTALLAGAQFCEDDSPAFLYLQVELLTPYEDEHVSNSVS